MFEYYPEPDTRTRPWLGLLLPFTMGDLRIWHFEIWIHDPSKDFNRGHVPDENETPHVRFQTKYYKRISYLNSRKFCDL